MALVDVEITITSARDLKNVNWKHGDLCAYAVAWIDDGSPQPLKVTSKVDSHGDTNPFWDQKFTLPVPKEKLEHARLIIEIYHDKAEDPSKAIVGRASLALLEAVDAGGYDEVQDYTMKLKRPSGRPHGKVVMSMRLREKRGAYGASPGYGQRDWQSAYPGYNSPYPAAQPYGQPYSAQPYNPAGGYPPYGAPYGAPPSQPYSSYPPQPYGAYAPPPQQQPYGAPPQDSYYNQTPPPYNQTPPPYNQDQTAAAKKSGSKFGGIGAGLAVGALAGAVGGLALGEFVEHKEDEAAKEQAEEDADRYAELEAARDDGYGGGYDDDY